MFLRGVVFVGVLALGGCCLDVSRSTGSESSSTIGTSGSVSAGSTTASATSTGSSSSGSTTGSTTGTTKSTSGTSGSSTGLSFDGGPYVATLAGNGMRGYTDGTGGPDGTAEFEEINAIALDGTGNLYVCDSGRLCTVDPNGNVTTIAGNVHLTPPDGKTADGTGGPDGAATFTNLWGVAVDSVGNVYVSDYGDNRIRKVDPEGNVTTLAGNGQQGSVDGSGGRNGTASFNSPAGLAIGPDGALYVADESNNLIRKVDSDGNVTTVTGPTGLNAPYGLSFDPSGNLVIPNFGSYQIVSLKPPGVPAVIAGSGAEGFLDGAASTAEFEAPAALAIDAAGNVYVADDWGNRIRMLDPAGNVSTIAGDGNGGESDGPIATAELSDPTAIAVDSAGNLFVADGETRPRIRVIHRQ